MPYLAESLRNELQEITMDKGEYKFTKPKTEESFWPENDIFSKILSLSENVITMEIKQDQPEKQAPKPLSEVEKAQAAVNEWKSKIETYSKGLEFAKKNLRIHEWALKKLQEINQ